MQPRINEIYPRLKQQNLDGLLVSLPANITYLTGHKSCDSWLLVSKKENIYLTDSRYTLEAKKMLSGPFRVKEANVTLFDLTAGLCRKLNLKNVGFEERNLSYAEYRKIRQKLDRAINFIPTHSLVEELRQVKGSEELENIKQACHITVSALKFIKNFISPGKREIEVAGEMERFIRYAGATASSFEIIVASGPNSSFPHHKTSGRKLKNNEPVLIDIGVEHNGYKSDLTRVFFLGKINVLARKIYEIVAAAQGKAIDEIRPGVKIRKVDAAGRQYIAAKGYAGFFRHNLGHGIGLEVHEAPNISPKEDSILKERMVFTIEPAIYLPGKFGIRLEDMVAVTAKNAEVLSGALDK